MAKPALTDRARAMCEALCGQMGFDLVDIALEKESAGRYLRLYIDKPGGITLDDCEAYHRAVMPRLADYDYDFLEVCSPGVDRPIKTERDVERNLGVRVELRLYKPLDGQKRFEGELLGKAADAFLVRTDAGERAFPAKDVAVMKPLVDMTGVDDVEL